jgi:hypothetical protein
MAESEIGLQRILYQSPFQGKKKIGASQTNEFFLFHCFCFRNPFFLLAVVADALS